MREVDIIKQTVAEEYSLTVDVFSSRARHEPIATARITALALCRGLTSFSREHLASLFNREAALVSYAVKQVQARNETDKAFLARFQRLWNLCNERIHGKEVA